MRSSETDTIKATIVNYLEGIQTGDSGRLEKAFYSSVNLSSLDEDGNLVLTPRDALVAYATGPDIPENTSEILEIDIVNDMAMAKIQINMPTYKYFDFLTLLKLNVGWKIVSKTYTMVKS